MHILIHALRGFAAVRDEDGIAGEKNARPRLPLEALLVCSPTLLKLVQKYVDFQTYGPKKSPTIPFGGCGGYILLFWRIVLGDTYLNFSIFRVFIRVPDLALQRWYCLAKSIVVP